MSIYSLVVGGLRSAALSVCAALLAAPVYFAAAPELYLWSSSNVLKLVVAPLLLGGALLVGLLRGREARANAGLAVIFTVLSLYIAEGVLQVVGPRAFSLSAFDRRNKIDVVMELRRDGHRAYPSIAAEKFLAEPLRVDDSSVVPLSGIAGARTVLCNEVGKYYIYDSDRHGFTNPDAAWREAPRVLLVGDSFTQGLCQPDGKSFAELLRSSVPGVLNLGMNGNGPLAELASIREYGARLAPAKVVWLYFEGNDFDDLSSELRSPVLPRYLEDSLFSQGLFDDPAGMQKALVEYLEAKISLETDGSLGARIRRLKTELPGKMKLAVKLWETRVLLGLTDLKREWPLKTWRPPPLPDAELHSAFRAALARANAEVSAWGGKLHFVYLPAHRSFAFGIEHPWRRRVLEVARSLGMPVLDMFQVIGEQPDPLAMYPFRRDGHFSEEGNALLAESVRRMIGE